jgi:predicted neuraminidase
VGRLLSLIAWVCVLSSNGFAQPTSPSPTGLHRYLYVATPGVRDYLEYGGHGILEFDIDNGHKFVRRIPIGGLNQSGKPLNVKGVCVSVSLSRIYVSTIKTLMAVDLVSEKLLWERSYEGGCDRMSISPDGKTIYMPSLEGPFWNVLRAEDGHVLATVTPDSGAHNTVYGSDGKFAYLAGLKSPLLSVANTGSHSVERTVGPFSASIRPFTIDYEQSRCYVCINDLLGFEIGSIKSGEKIARIEVAGFSTGPVKRHGCPSHGIALSPDEREIWLTDAHNQRLHLFDNTVFPPKPIENIKLRDEPGWVTFTIDGEFAYPSTGEVIDRVSRTIICQLIDEENRSVQSEKIVEVDWQDGKPVQCGDQFGIGRAKDTPPPSDGTAEDVDRDTFTSEFVFPLHHQHNHAPGIVEYPNGDLLVSWYRGSGERSSDDVAVFGSRKSVDSQAWSEPFLMADRPGFPDCNTCMMMGNDGRLWLFWPTILANSWESCITNFKVSSDFENSLVPKWSSEGLVLIKPDDFRDQAIRILDTTLAAVPKEWLNPKLKQELEDVRSKIESKLYQRLGWQPRCKPTILPSGRILLPLYTDTFSISIMAISDDNGQSWRASKPLIGFGNIQPTVLRKDDGTLVAYMRENGLTKRIRVAESTDDGETWGEVGVCSLPNPGAGIDAVRLRNGHWVMIYNDTTQGRNSLAVSVSDDEGGTWKWTRHLELQPLGSFHYPAVIQTADDRIHVVYSYFVEGGKTMKHAAFREQWVQVDSEAN